MSRRVAEEERRLYDHYAVDFGDFDDEEPVVEKRAVPKERVRLGKRCARSRSRPTGTAERDRRRPRRRNG